MKGKFNSSSVLYILAGGYLLYLVYGLVKEMVNGQVPESRLLLIGGITIVFAVCSLILLLLGIRSYRTHSADDRKEEEG